MNRNNYTKSETPWNIEAYTAYDTGESYRLFKENFEVLQHSSYSRTDVFFYTSGGTMPDINFTIKGTRQAKEAALTDWYEAEDMATWPESDLDAEIIARYEVTLIDYVLERLTLPNTLEAMPDKKFNVISSTGYSQGDYAKVIYSPDDFGATMTQSDIQKAVDHFIWDTPIYARVTVNGEDYHYFDMDDYNEYEWNRDKFAAYVSKESGAPLDAIMELLPENPSYN